jgi:hypothetical protein
VDSNEPFSSVKCWEVHNWWLLHEVIHVVSCKIQGWLEEYDVLDAV